MSGVLEAIQILAVSSLSNIYDETDKLNSSCKIDELLGQPEYLARLDSCSENEVAEVASLFPDLDRSVHLGIAAARRLQLRNPRLFSLLQQQKALAINIGSSRGATDTWERLHGDLLKGKPLPATASPLTTLGNVSSWLAQYLVLDACAFSHSVTCSTSAHAIANAVAWIRSGMSEYFIAGGVEACLTPFTLAQMKALRLYADPTKSLEFACRPCAKDRISGEGMVLGEGACLFVLAKADSVRATELKPLAKIIGFGFAQERIKSATAIDPQGQGFEQAMRQALSQCKQTVDLVLMHAPGTRKGDSAEYQAIERVFSEYTPALYSNKWQVGHTFAASSALSLELAIDIINKRYLPSFPYPTFFADRFQLSEQIISSRGVKTVMINAAGFGGNVVSFIVSA